MSKKPKAKLPPKKSAAKRAPVQRRGPKVQRRPVTADTLNISVKLPSGKVVESLRLLAKQHYMISSDSIAVMSRMPYFATLAPATLERWAHLDKWTAARKDWRTKMESRVQKALLDEVVQERRKQHLQMASMRNELFTKLESKVAELTAEDIETKDIPRFIGALAKVHELSDALIDKLAEGVLPNLYTALSEPEVKELPQVKPQLSAEEAREAARLLIRMRRERMRAEAEGSDKPSLRVVDGKTVES